MVDGGPRQVRVKPHAARTPLTNYYRGAPKADSPFQKKTPPKKLVSRAIKLVDVLVLLAVIFCLIYSLIVRPEPKVIATSTTYQPIYIYQGAAAKAIANVKDRTKLTFDENSLAATLQKEFPEISAVSVELPIIGQKPVIRLSIAEPNFIFDSQGRQYILAGNGVVVPDHLNSLTAKSLPTLQDQSGFKASLGKAVLSSSEMLFINQVVAQCKHAKIQIASLSLPAAAQELDLRTQDKNYFVKFYLGGDPLVETGQFLAARHQFAVNHQDPSQYLDVRVPGKIFYK